MKATTSISRSSSWQRPSRRGLTLVELITVMTVGSILISILTAMVVQVTRIEATTRNRIAQSLAITRMSDQFREDVRAARNVELLAENGDRPSKLVVMLGDSIQVDYSQSGSGIDRVMHRDGDIAARDRYQLPPDVQAAWSQPDFGDVPLARVDLILHPANRQLFSIVAHVGRHRRAEPAAPPAEHGQEPAHEKLENDER